MNCSVFLNLTLVKPFSITCITFWSWKRNILRLILRKSGMNIEKIIWKNTFWFWVAWFDMYIALASISIDLHNALPYWDTVLLKRSIAFKKLSFDCLNKSVNSRLKEASSFSFSKKSLSRCAADNFYSRCFLFWSINFGTLFTNTFIFTFSIAFLMQL